MTTARDSITTKFGNDDGEFCTMTQDQFSLEELEVIRATYTNLRDTVDWDDPNAAFDLISLVAGNLGVSDDTDDLPQVLNDVAAEIPWLAPHL